MELGLIDRRNFEEPDKKPAKLFQKVLATKSDAKDLLFAHADYCLSNVILKDFRLSGFVDWAKAGVADRYQDIALMARSIGHTLGEEWIRFVFEALETEPDWEKIEFYTLLDEFF